MVTNQLEYTNSWSGMCMTKHLDLIYFYWNAQMCIFHNRIKKFISFDNSVPFLFLISLKAFTNSKDLPPHYH